MQKSIELNKGWLLCTDSDNKGIENGFALEIQCSSLPAPVPGIIQQIFRSYHGTAWYYLKIDKLPVTPEKNELLILKFGAVDYFSELFIDGKKVLENEGAENEFEADVTGILKEGSLIALRVINPKKGEYIDGFEMTQVPHRNKDDGRFMPGCCYNSGGIMLPVTLYTVPAVRVTDVFVKPDSHTGKAEVDITVKNSTSSVLSADISASFRFSDNKYDLLTESYSLTAEPGENLLRVNITIDNYKLWDIDSPNLYYLTVRCKTDSTSETEYTVHFGFRDFRVENGFFTLNGRRIFLKSAHTGNHMPKGLSLVSPDLPYLEYKDFQLAKASGFNCLRFIATQATPRQLDYCDELGLMVYQETYASWCMADTPESERRYNESIEAEIKRDRNHPCLTIWGALNETFISDVFYTAVKVLPRIRALDETRLCIFSSGRFDLVYPSERAKPDYSIGCVSNPGSNEWDCVWGDDGNTDDSAPRTPGDLHIYPDYPFSEETGTYLRNYGKGIKPCFFSEFGVGSALNVIENCLDFERYETDPETADYLAMSSIRERYLKEYDFYGLSDTFASPVDFLRASEKFNALSRRDSFDLVRSNPQFVGYNVTGLLDHAICGEGPFTLFRRFKPDNFDVFADGWYDLRWCIFIGKENIYSGDEQIFEAVLSDIDVLKDGEYTVEFAVTNENGAPVWKTVKKFTLPEYDPQGLRLLVHNILKEKVRLDAAPGKYSFRAYLKNGGYAASSEKEFYISSRPVCDYGRKIASFGLTDNVKKLLIGYGFDISASPEESDTILVGATDGQTGRRIMDLVRGGKKAIFIDGGAIISGTDGVGYGAFLNLPDFTCGFEPSALYHKETIILADRMNCGLKTGFLDWRYYWNCSPVRAFYTTKKADDYYSVNMFVGAPGEYHSSVNLARFNEGSGSFILNTFPIAENAGISPAADMILLNLLR